MTYKKIVFGLLFVMFGSSLLAVAREDVRDKFGRTKLMNYVRDREALVAEYRGSYYELSQCFMHETNNTICNMIDSPSVFYTKDHDGKTVLNHCYTPEMYNILRNAGAPFQFDAWFHVYKYHLASASLSIAGTVYVLNQEGILTTDAISSFAQDTRAAGAILAANMKESFQSVDAAKLCQCAVDAAIDTAEMGFYFLLLFMVLVDY